MEDSEILARFAHEEEMRKQLEQDLKQHDEWARAKFEASKAMDRWRWGVGIAVGLVLSRTPDGLEFIQKFFD